MKSLILVLSLVLLNVNPALAQSGGMGGHGGDSISQEFYQIGRSLLGKIRKFTPTEMAQLPEAFSIDLLELAIQKASISSTNEVLELNHVMVDAINFPIESPPRILVNRNRWLGYKNTSIRKEGIVLHEYLGIMKGLSPSLGEWDEYSISTKILLLLSKTKQRTSIQNQAWIQSALTAFDSATSVRVNLLERGLNYSCVEYSLLSDAIDPIAVPAAYSSSLLARSESSGMASDLRMNQRGDLFVKLSDTENQNPIAIRYCPKLESKSIQMVQFLSESLLPIFDTPETSAFADYVSKIEKLRNSSSYRRCAAKSTPITCLKFLEKFSSIKLSNETTSLAQAKTNIHQINSWLDSLGQNKFKVNSPILKLFDRYVAHQEYLQGLLDLGDRADGYDNFIESLKNRIPSAYRSSRNDFLQETRTVKLEFIETFWPAKN